MRVKKSTWDKFGPPVAFVVGATFSVLLIMGLAALGEPQAAWLFCDLAGMEICPSKD
jgi:4-hydroxybenzoate polyprenyltransferase